MSQNTVPESINSIQLKPGQIIRPDLSVREAVQLIERLYGVKVKSISELNSYDDKNYRIEVEQEWSNTYISALWPDGYIFKVLNSMDSKKKHVDAEHKMEYILDKIGINCPIPELNVYGAEYSLEKINRKKSEEFGNNNDGGNYSIHLCRLMRYVPGKILIQVAYIPPLMYEVGQYVARIQQALKGFDHPALHSHKTIWSLASLPDLKDFLYVIDSGDDKSLICDILDAFSKEVIPHYNDFTQGVIHGDFNEQNIIVREKSNYHTTPAGDQFEHEVCGILDFGDSSYSYYIFDLAIAIMYMSVDSEVIDPVLVGGHVIAGYYSKISLNQAEFEALKFCVAGRYAQSLVMGQYTLSVDPGNEYVAHTAKNGWPQLRKLWAMPKDELYQKWRFIMDSYKAVS